MIVSQESEVIITFECLDHTDTFCTMLTKTDNCLTKFLAVMMDCGADDHSVEELRELSKLAVLNSKLLGDTIGIEFHTF